MTTKRRRTPGQPRTLAVAPTTDHLPPATIPTTSTRLVNAQPSGESTDHPRGNAVRPHVLRYLMAYPDVPCWRADIARETGLREAQVAAAAVTLHTINDHVRVIERGHCWQYDTVPQKTEETNTAAVYTVIGETKTGIVVLEGPDGNLYRAVALD